MNLSLSEVLESVVRKGGTAFNGLILAGFIYAAFSLYGAGNGYLVEAGGVSGLKSALSSVQAAAGFALSPDAAWRILSYALAWLSYIGAAGCGWMALLGLRWFFHALVRWTMTFRH